MTPTTVKIDADIEMSNNKQEIVDCIMNGFSTRDPNDPYGDLSPTYRECLEKKLFAKNAKYQHFTMLQSTMEKLFQLQELQLKILMFF